MMKIYTCKCKKNRSLPLSVIEKAITQFYNFYFIFKHCWEFDIENKLNIFIGDNKVQVTFVFEINCDMLLGNIIDPGQHFAIVFAANAFKIKFGIKFHTEGLFNFSILLD